LTRQVGVVTRATNEQAGAMKELTAGIDGVRAQSDQAARAAKEQARTMNEIAKTSERTAKEIRGVASANKQQSGVAKRVVAQVGEVRRITERNAEGVGKTRGDTTDLLRQAEALTALMAHAGGNGRG
jgi:methyl-accepting chemotaxis protein